MAQASLTSSFRLNAPTRDEGADQTASTITVTQSFRLNPSRPDEHESLQPSNAVGYDVHTVAHKQASNKTHPSHFASSSADPPVQANELAGNQKKSSTVGETETTTDQQQQPYEQADPDGSSETARGPKIPSWCTRKVVIFGIVVGAVLVVAIVLISIYVPEENSSKSTTTLPMPTLATIKARGTLQCGVGGQFGFSAINKTTGRREGLEVDLCRAVGAAIFGGDGHVQYSVVSNDNQFSMLQSGRVDLLAAGTKYTVQSDIFEPSTNTGFSFSAPYLHSGLTFAGIPQFLSCAESLQTTGNCANLTICVQDGTDSKDTLTSLFPNFQGIKLAPSQPDLYDEFKKGFCNVMAGSGIDLIETSVTGIGYTGPYNISRNQFSKEPLALVTRDGDVEWSDFVNWVLLGLLTAESETITQYAAKNAKTASTDAESQAMLYNVVATVGNYGEIYERNLGSLIPRAYVNTINNGSSPLIASIPFGNLNVTGPGPTAGGTLEQITRRGSLRCGVAENAFFSTFDAANRQWSGLDIDLCRAVSAALFGSTSTPVFVNVTAANRFQELANGNIDIISRTASVTYERDVNEPTTGRGFSFSQPYFYSGVQFGGIPPYGECADNLDVTSAACESLLICVTEGTTTMNTVRSLFPERYIIPKASKLLVRQCLATNESNAIAGDGFDTANVSVREVYTGPYQEGTKLFTRDVIALVTNQNDNQWTSFVSLVVTATFYAEENNVTQATFESMPTVSLFGPDYASMLRNVIEAVGSYGQMYGRSANSNYPRLAVNVLNTPPFGPQHFPPPGLFIRVN